MILERLQQLHSNDSLNDLSLDLHIANYMIQLLSDYVTFSSRLKKTNESSHKMNKYIQDSCKYKYNTVPVSFQFKNKELVNDCVSDLFFFIQHTLYELLFSELKTLETEIEKELSVFRSFTLPDQEVGSRHIPEKERIEIFTKYFPEESIQENQWVQSGENNEQIMQRIHTVIMEKYTMEEHAKNIDQIRSFLSTTCPTIEKLYSLLNNIGIYCYNIQGT